MYKKCLFFINGLLRTGKRRSLVYLTSKEECELYKYIFIQIMEKYHFYNILIDQITCETNKKERIEILNNFEKEEDYEVLKIILSIRILDEGIDIVKCDSIFITQVNDNNNDIRYLQRICRANRLNPNNLNKKASIFIWSDDKNKILNTLHILKINDINLNKKIKVNNSNYGSYKKEEKIKFNKELLNNEIIDYININCLTEEEIWEKKKELLFEFCNLKKRCIYINETYNNHSIGNWYYSQKIKINNNLNIYKDLYFKLILNNYVKDNLEKKSSSISYSCKRCNYKTNRYSNIAKHLNIKKQCNRTLESYNYSNDQLFILSLLPYDENNYSIDEKEIDYLKKSNEIIKYKEELFILLEKIDKQKLKNCECCSEKFNKILELKKHILISCFYKKLEKENKIEKLDKNLTNNIE